MSTFSYRIEVRPDHLFLWQQGLPGLPAIQRMQADLEQTMRRTGLRLLLTDNRLMETPDEDTRGYMMRWFDQPGLLDAIALVVNSPMIAVRTNMDALVHRAHRRGFHSIDEATAWLCSDRKK